MNWTDVGAVTDEWADSLAAPAAALRLAVGPLFTATPVGYYLDPLTKAAAAYAPKVSPTDAARIKLAGGPTKFLERGELAGSWVKVAYSHTLRRAGELLNFFPGQYPGGIPNSPSPLAAMLTSGLLGAGLGWAGGRIAKKFVPEGYGENLGRTGAILGGLLGAAPGAIWAAGNYSADKPLNSPDLLAAPAGSQPNNYPSYAGGTNIPGKLTILRPDLLPGGSNLPMKTVHAHYVLAGFEPEGEKVASDDPFATVRLGADCLRGIKVAAESFGGFAEPRIPGPADVSIDHLGRTLWDGGADPRTAATVMGTAYAASRMPDPDARPGWVTGRQLGEFAENAAGDYATGWIVGKALNLAVGTPYSAPAFGLGAAALGAVSAIVPRLFGRGGNW